MGKSERTWRTREHRISYEKMREWLPQYQKSFERARMKLSGDFDQLGNPEDRLYDIEVSDKRLDDREARHKALTMDGWQFSGTQEESLYEQRKALIQERYGEHLVIPAVCAISGEPRETYVEVFARKDALERALNGLLDDLSLQRVVKRAEQTLKAVEDSTRDNEPPAPRTSPPEPFLRIV